MKTPDKYKKWLMKIKKSIDYSDTDEQAFEIEVANYLMMYNLYQLIKDGGGGYRDCLMYNTLLSKHLKFLDTFGLNGSAKLKNKYLKKKVDDVGVVTDPKDQLDRFLLN